MRRAADPLGRQDWATGSAYIMVAAYKTIALAIIIITIAVSMIIAIIIAIMHTVANTSSIICIR